MNLMYKDFCELMDDFEYDERKVWAFPKKSISYDLPYYGFKIHISAILKNAYLIFSIVKEILDKHNVSYKVISSMQNLEELNTGKFGYSQIGKFCTVYPKSNESIEVIADELYSATLGFQSVDIPSDFRYKNSSIVYYRYGEINIEKRQGRKKDKRDKYIPKGINVPIRDHYIPRFPMIPNKYMPLACLRSRGKTRIFHAIDIESKKPVILKEGVMLGEIDELNRDGVHCAMNEMSVLSAVSDLKHFPKLIDSFYAGSSFYVVEEFIQGKAIREYLTEKDAVLPMDRATILLKIANIIEDLDSRMLVIGDFSPDNIIVNNHEIRMIDVEYYYVKGKKPKYVPGTPGFFYDDYKDDKAIIYGVLSLWYYLDHPKEYVSMLKKNKNVYYNVNNINKYVKIDPRVSEVIQVSCIKDALPLLREIF